MTVAGGSWPRIPVPETSRARVRRRFGQHLLLALFAFLSAAPAAAEVGVSVSALNDDLFRGRSLSQGRPILTADLSYDDLSGIYVGGSVTGVATRHSGAELLGFGGYAGYARRITPGITLDAGISNTRYTRWYSGGVATDYTEFYAGIITSHVSSHIRYSPDYLGTGEASIYADLDGVLRPADKWRLNGHMGLLMQVSGPDLPATPRDRFDWRISVSREIGRFALQVGWTGVTPGKDWYADKLHSGSSPLIGATYIF